MGSAPTSVPEHVLTIGDIDGPNAISEPLPGLRRGVVGSDGNLYLYFWRERQVGVFDAAGQRIRTVGRAGGGPGEFLSGGTIWSRPNWIEGALQVVDQGRINTYPGGGRDGASTARSRRVAYPPEGDTPAPTLAAELADGTPVFSERIRSDSTPQGDRLHLYLASAGEGSELRSWTDLRYDGSRAEYRDPTGAVRRIGWHPLPVQELWSPAVGEGAGIVVLDALSGAGAGAISIRVLDRDGRMVRERDITVGPPRPITPEVQAVIFAPVMTSLRRTDWARILPDEELVELLAAGAPLPEFVPPAADLATMSTDEYWVQVSDAFEEGEGRRFLVFAPDLSLRHEVVLPRGLMLLDVRGQLLWGWERGEWDEVRLVQMRMPG